MQILVSFVFASLFLFPVWFVVLVLVVPPTRQRSKTAGLVALGSFGLMLLNGLNTSHVDPSSTHLSLTEMVFRLVQYLFALAFLLSLLYWLVPTVMTDSYLFSLKHPVAPRSWRRWQYILGKYWIWREHWEGDWKR